MIPFELLYRKIFHDPISSTFGVNADFLKTRIKDIALSGFRSYHSPNSIFSEDEIRILKTLKDDPNVVIIKPNKGNGLVIFDKSDYNQKMMDILNNSDKFKKLDGDPVKISIERENRIKNFLRQLKKENIINVTLYSSLRPTGSRPGILYGLAKAHKLNIPLRPISSSINSHSYNIANQLVSLLLPFSTKQYPINDSFSFLQELHSLDLNIDNVFMASFDITSLFSNIPLDEIIDILSNDSLILVLTVKAFLFLTFVKFLI